MNRAECLKTAAEITQADRQNDYGSPEDNFRKIAAYWTIYLNKAIEPKDVAVMMTMLKIARLDTSPKKEDNWVDAAGYIACGCEIATNG